MTQIKKLPKFKNDPNSKMSQIKKKLPQFQKISEKSHISEKVPNLKMPYFQNMLQISKNVPNFKNVPKFKTWIFGQTWSF